MSPDAGLLSPRTGKGGSFVAVVGPSGAGKDTLIARAQAQLADRPEIVFARRTVTRRADPQAEDHESLDARAFESAAAQGAFCLTWSAHGLSYGIPAHILDAIDGGRIVVANVSRTALPEIAGIFRPFHVVEVTAAPDILAGRIAARGRESEAEIATRIARSACLVVPPEAAFHRIDNSGSLEDAAEAFTTLIHRIACDLHAPRRAADA